MLCFVDDLAILCKNAEQAGVLIEALRKGFTLRDSGEIHNYVGLDITKVLNGYKISQRGKIAALLRKFNMEQCNGVKTPMETDFEKDESPSPMFDTNMYKSLLGSLMYISQWSRSDIAMACNLLARASSQPKQKHWLAAKRVLRYLKQTIDLSLYLEPKGGLSLTAYVDANFASDTETRKSTSGMTLFLAGALVGWKTVKQRHVLLSTCESEFAALSLMCSKLIWYNQLMLDLGIQVPKPITVMEDNQAAIQMAMTPGVRGRSKHTDVRFQNVKQCVSDGLISLTYCESSQNVADALTKVQGTNKHLENCEMLGLRV